MDFIFDPSLTLYLPLEQLDGSSFTSKDACGHLCTVTGAALEPGRGRYFDGTDDYITIPDTASLRMGTDDWTVLAWIQAPNAGWQYLLMKGSGGSGVMGYGLTLDADGAMRVDFSDGSSRYLTVGIKAINGDDFWFIAGTWDRDDVSRVFLNGEQDSKIDISGADGVDINNTTAIQIGRYSSGSAELTGVMPFLAMFRRALTPLEIRNIYLQTKWRYR